MEDSSEDFKEITKVSFQRVKQHILDLESAIKEDRKFLIKQNEAILLLKSQMEELLGSVYDLRDKMLFNDSSSGNDGVINNHQQSSTIINNHQQSSTTINSHQQSTVQQEEPSEVLIETAAEEQFDDKRPLSDLKKELQATFGTLTDREFSVYMAVYQLEEQLPDVNYSDISKMLNISEMTVRGYINSLISKKIPLEKKRLYNRKVVLAIPKEFRDLNLASFLLTLRLPSATFVPQKTLKHY